MNWSRWRKFSLRVGLGLLALTMFLFGSIRLTSWWVMHSRRDRVANALESARTVRLEELLGDKVLSQKLLDAEQRATAMRLVRGAVTSSSLFSLKLCFVPHHRIVATGANGVEFIFTICFECDQAQFTGSDIFEIPAAWSSPLRQLFRSKGMTVNEARE